MPKGPDAIDKFVGKNIRIFRLAKGLSQTELGNALGLTFQQVQKYEKGVNRVGSGRLSALSNILDVPIERFFTSGAPKPQSAKSNDTVTELLASPYALRMLKALARIPSKNLRRSLVTLTESIGEAPKH